MAEVTLTAATGRRTGSAESRRIRRTGAVPAIVYGKDLDQAVPVTVDHRELQTALHTDAGANVLINLQLDGNQVLTMAREVERHPYRSEIRHVDFVQVSLTEKVEAEVPVSIEGEAIGVQQGGVLSSARTVVTVEALPTDLPGSIPLDVSALEIGDALRISDLPDIAGVEYLDDSNAVVLSVTAPAVEEPEPVEEVEGEEVEGEEVEGAEGAEAGEEEPADAE